MFHSLKEYDVGSHEWDILGFHYTARTWGLLPVSVPPHINWDKRGKVTVVQHFLLTFSPLYNSTPAILEFVWQLYHKEGAMGINVCVKVSPPLFHWKEARILGFFSLPLATGKFQRARWSDLTLFKPAACSWSSLMVVRVQNQDTLLWPITRAVCQ